MQATTCCDSNVVKHLYGAFNNLIALHPVIGGGPAHKDILLVQRFLRYEYVQHVRQAIVERVNDCASHSAAHALALPQLDPAQGTGTKRQRRAAQDDHVPDNLDTDPVTGGAVVVDGGGGGSSGGGGAAAPQPALPVAGASLIQVMKRDSAVEGGIDAPVTFGNVSPPSCNPTMTCGGCNSVFELFDSMLVAALGVQRQRGYDSGGDDVQLLEGDEWDGATLPAKLRSIRLQVRLYMGHVIRCAIQEQAIGDMFNKLKTDPTCMVFIMDWKVGVRDLCAPDIMITATHPRRVRSTCR